MSDLNFSLDVVMNMIDNNIDKLNDSLKTTSDLSKDVDQNFKNIDLDLGSDGVNVDAFNQASELASSLNVNLDQLDGALGRNDLSVKRNGKIWDQQRLRYLSANQALNKVRDSTQAFSFDFLSLTFGGIILQTTFGRVFRGLTQGFLDLTNQNNEFKQSVNDLNASFTFLKFSIGKSFAESPIVAGAVDTLTDALEDLGGFFDDYPNIGASIVVVSGALTLLGGSLLALGSASQLFGAGGTLTALFSTLRKVGGFLATPTGLGIAATILTIAGALSLLRDEEGNFNFENVNDSFSDLKDSVTDLFQTINPDIENFDEVWIIVKNSLVATVEILINLFTRTLQFFVNFTKTFIELGIDIWNTARVIGNALKLDFDGAKDAFDDLKSSGKDTVTAFKSLADPFVGFSEDFDKSINSMRERTNAQLKEYRETAKIQEQIAINENSFFNDPFGPGPSIESIATSTQGVADSQSLLNTEVANGEISSNSYLGKLSEEINKKKELKRINDEVFKSQSRINFFNRNNMIVGGQYSPYGN